MAKTQIKDYVFKPGIGATDNLAPNAWALLNSNKEFIQKEVNAYITSRIANAAQYTPTAATYTPTTGVMELTIGTHTFNVGDAVTIATESIVFTCALDGNATTHAYPRSSGVPNDTGTDPSYNKAVEIIATTATTITLNVGISSDTSTHTFDSASANAITDTFYNYVNTSQDKCERDMGYVIDAYLNDLRYGGNQNLRDTIKYYWDQGVAQVDGDRGPEVAAHNYIGRLIKDYILTNTAISALNTEIPQTIDTSLTAEVATYTPTNAVYTPSTGTMVLTIPGHDLTLGSQLVIAPESLTFTCELDNNATNHSYPRASGTQNYNNSTGRDPFYRTATLVTAVTTNTVTIDVGFSSDTSKHTFVSATSNCISTSAADIIDTYVYGTVNVILNGKSHMPTVVETGIGHVRIQGRYDLDQILLITNVTKNEIIYSFNSPTQGGAVTLKTDGVAVDEDFPKYLQTTDAITTIKFNFNTITHSPTDELQIFVEKIENGKSLLQVRPYDFGTDAIERMRVAPALSMLDADFEYGLQPTKWAAIGTLRGYPSVYEIPGTDTPVKTVITDASFGNSAIRFDYSVSANGTSDWVFVETNDRLGVVTGNDPTITIQEGDRIRITNTEGSAHPIYIKTTAGTGTGNQVDGVIGQGAYTGGTTDTIDWQTEIGDAGTYYYQCSSHANMVGQIVVVQPTGDQVGVGQSLITVTTEAPHGFTAGTPITIKALEDSIVGAARAEGSFVIVEVPSTTTFTYYAKSKVGTANGQVLATTYTQLRQAGFYTGANIGSPAFTVLSNGTSGTLTPQLDIAIGSTIIPYDGPSPQVGAPLTSNSIPIGTQVTSIIDTSAGGGEYITPLVDGSYIPGATSIQLVNATGVVQDLALDRGDGTAVYIETVDTNTNTVTLSGGLTTGFIGNQQTYTGVTGNEQIANGSNAEFTITRTNGTYTVDAITNIGTGYALNDRILIGAGQLGGVTPDHELVLLVSGVNATGGITSTIIEGSGIAGIESFTDVSGTNDGSQGVNAAFDITFVNNVYTASITSPDNSLNYTVNDIIVIPGNVIDPNAGLTPDNDLILTVNTVGAGGAITSVTETGTAPDARLFSPNPSYTTSGAGTGAQFNISTIGTVYSAAVQGGFEGINFVPTDTITILGTELGGTSPANDCTITVDSVDGSGAITSVSVSGTAYNGASFPGITNGTTRVGNQGTFDVTLNSGSYNVSVNNGGTGYGVGQTITIPAGENTIGGASPGNDLTLTILSVDSITTGVITSVGASGTAVPAVATYSGITGVNQQINGNGLTFDITRNNGVYTSVAFASAGNGYEVGNTFTIPGTLLDGLSPANDVTVVVDTVEPSTGAVTLISFTAGPAVQGDDFILYSTLIVTEATTGPLAPGDTITYGELATLRITFPTAHGLVPGDSFITSITSDDGVNNHQLASGSFFATNIPAVNQLDFQARAEGNIDTSNGDPFGEVYPRPDSFFIHRPYDGGVQLGTGGPQHGAQAIRQSKKYIRYQSGKGIMYTTGALFAPSYDLRSIEAEDVEVGSLITVVCDDNDHGVQEGGIIRLLGVETPGYNSGPETAVPPQFDYTVVEVVDERTFKIRAQRRLGATSAVLGFGAQMSVVSWHGATVRSGIFDDQNGIFWEFDGTNLSVNQRTGTRQLAGTIAMTVDQNLVTGTSTRFLDQLKAGDRIIVKGMTHVVSHVNSQTECTVTPDWRGVVDIQGTKANLITDKKVKQENFNLDRLDGTGPSGYDLDIAKMQMIGIQYSWYGAGFIDFMLRGSDGNFVFCHRMRNSNVNTEAFMRSGNLPVRYEVTNEGPSGKLSAAMDATQTTIPLEDSSFFPDYGTVYIDNEIITFTANNKTTNTLTGAVRGATFTNFQAGATRSYEAGVAATHNDRTGVILISQTITPLISHWGSAFITDGGFDEDRGYIFSYTETGLDISTTKQTAFMIRLSPSVSNAIVGDLGERELLNRAQLLLQSLEITSEGAPGGTPVEGGIVVEGVLNPSNYPLDPSSVLWQTLSSQAQGGQPSFAQIAGGGSIQWSTGAAAVVQTVDAYPGAGVTYPALYYRSWTDTIYIDEDDIDSVGGPPALGSEFTIVGITPSYNYQYPTNNGNRWVRIFPGTTVTDVKRENNNDRYRIRLSQRFEGEIYNTQTYSFSFGEDLTNRNYAYLDQASFETSGASTGTAVTGGTVTFPANTAISRVTQLEHGGDIIYEVTFNNTFSGTLLQASGNIEFTFEEPPFAQPGETVFSFIAQPGERATVDFSELKELTNTPLGGRGTYPNGPDVLAINVYKVSGAATAGNVILKWGEAQA